MRPAAASTSRRTPVFTGVRPELTPIAIDPADFLSMGKATPFAGWEVQGRCLLTAAGETAAWYDADRLLKGE